MNQQSSGGKLYDGLPRIRNFRNKKWKCNQKTIEYVLNNNEVENFFEASNLVDQFFEEIYDEHIRHLNSHYFVQYILSHDSFKNPIRSFYMRRKDFSSPTIMQNEFESVLQSRKKPDEVQTHNRFKVIFNIIENRQIQGGAFDSKKKEKRICKEKREIINQKDYLKNSRSIKIINSDNFCLVRAVLVGKAFADKEKNAYLLLRKNNRILNFRVKELVSTLGLSDRHLNIEDLNVIDNYLKEYQITLYDSIADGSTILYPTSNRRDRKLTKFINITYEDNHFNTITSMTAYLNSSYYCEHCRVKYQNLGDHNCESVCACCFRLNYVCKEIQEENLEISACKDCFLTPKNSYCKYLHESSHCLSLNLCRDCGNKKSKKHPHVCGEKSKWCPNCKKSVDFEHRCFIKKPSENDEKKKFQGFIWYDIEAFVNEDGFHEANLIMAKRRCTNCLNVYNISSICSECNLKYEFTKIEDFISWILNEKNKNFIFISHNGKNYDHYFVMRYLQKSKTIRDTNVSAITNGKKIMSFEFRKRIFKDSSLFIAKPLETFSKTFNLKNFKKGFWPHDFNRQSNFFYVGKYPAKEFYKSEFFNSGKKDEFNLWYDSVKDSIFDFDKEIREYCWNDVELLSNGCLEFSRIMKEISKKDPNDPGLDPFVESITLSSFVNKFYRRNFMQEDSIPWIPSNGYNPLENTSKKAETWLKYLANKEKIHIQHAKNGGEKRVGKYLLDGFSEKSKKIFEFNGCLYHGCEKCFGYNSFNPVLQVMNSTLRERTRKKLNYLKFNFPDFEIITCWEHEYDKMCENDLEFRNFLKSSKPIVRLELRDALYGGHTNAFCLYHKCKPQEKINYYDFCSLYPYIMKNGVYPKGQGKYITENFDYTKNYFGIIKARLLPPKGLLHPVLPLKLDKLIFPLCTKCAIERNPKISCNHSESERIIEGTWVSLEFDKALKQGYKLVEYMGIYEYEEKYEYDIKTKSGGLFAEFVNTNLKNKQMASGWPDHVKTEDEKNAFIDDYFNWEGIVLDKSKIEKNSGMREIAKLILNSLWGYFALNSNKAKFKILTKPIDLENLLNDDQFIVHHIDFTDDDFVQVTFSQRDEFCFGGLNTNVVIAAFTTAQARLKLYDEISKLGDRILYCDTDSLIFLEKPGEYRPQLGDFLGMLTNEIKENDYITEFCSGGPKCYAYKLASGSTDCIIKGYQVNYLSSIFLNFESLKYTVLKDQKNEIVVPQLHFDKDKAEWLIKTSFVDKKYKIKYDKRKIIKRLKTVPWGF